MATVYEVKIKTVSPWVNYDEAYIKKMFEKFLNQQKFENTEVEVIEIK